MENKLTTPWYGHTGDVPLTLQYPNTSLYEELLKAALKYPKLCALEFMNSKTNFDELLRMIHQTAKSLKKSGVKQNDVITIALPNCPQAVYLFYAANMIGAITSVVHPLSAEKELEFYINKSKSKYIFVLDQFYKKINAIRNSIDYKKIVVCCLKDEMSLLYKIGYDLKEAKKCPKIEYDENILKWNDFLRSGSKETVIFESKNYADEVAVILYSGGTTGTSKGIMLTNKNLNALRSQLCACVPALVPGDVMLTAMPIFHAFGLGICVHTILTEGACSVLIPRFTAKSYGELIAKKKCNHIAGVPTLFESLTRIESLKGLDYSHLKDVFSGGDSLSPEMKHKLEKFFADHGANIKVREGYGATETGSACCLGSDIFEKDGAIGFPMPDMFVKIVKPGTDIEMPLGEEGEILLSGPTVMKCYLDDEKETQEALKTHSDGKLWLYTGDLGKMDTDGFLYFTGRAKRVIVTSGYNVYPNQLESILDGSPLIHKSCVIGVKDDLRVQRVKAYIILETGVEKSEETKQKIIEYCRKAIARYAVPREIVFVDELPLTKIGKVAYKVLEEQNK